jgi:hypothetical protein
MRVLKVPSARKSRYAVASVVRGYVLPGIVESHKNISRWKNRQTFAQMVSRSSPGLAQDQETEGRAQRWNREQRNPMSNGRTHSSANVNREHDWLTVARLRGQGIN